MGAKRDDPLVSQREDRAAGTTVRLAQRHGRGQGSGGEFHDGGKVAIIDFSKARVTIVGDYIEDHWHYGTVDRLSPEGPWPVFSRRDIDIKPGGTGNVAENCRALGVEPLVFTPAQRS